ncbi:MAG: hypothetical protein AB1509_12530 [Chloroflexota bacterium]
MNTKTLSFIVLSMILLFNACSPLTTIVSSSGEQPTPIESYDQPSAGYQPITVDQVEVGVGSPIPAGWSTYTSASQQCGYAISYPSEIQVSEQTPYSQIFGFDLTDSDAGARNFVYVSVITPEIQNKVKQGLYEHDVYNYDPMATEILQSERISRRLLPRLAVADRDQLRL